MLTPYQPGGVDYAHLLALPCLKKICDYAPVAEKLSQSVIYHDVQSFFPGN